MSDTGLYSGVYQKIGEYADLVDNVLIMMIADQIEGKNTNYNKLGGILLALAEKKNINTSITYVSMTIEDTNLLTEKQLQRLGQNLVDGAVDDKDIITLERFAQLLERERTKVMARMRSR